jgi:hypothetical protein
LRRVAPIRIAPSFLLEYPLRTDQAIGEIRSPVLSFTATRDTLIPLADSERLRALERSPVELVAVESRRPRRHGYVEPLAQRLSGVR